MLSVWKRPEATVCHSTPVVCISSANGMALRSNEKGPAHVWEDLDSGAIPLTRRRMQKRFSTVRGPSPKILGLQPLRSPVDARRR